MVLIITIVVVLFIINIITIMYINSSPSSPYMNIVLAMVTTTVVFRTTMAPKMVSLMMTATMVATVRR